MKYYVISDIHGHYDEMKRDLDLQGYDDNNDNHHLIVVGDMCDRGLQSVEVLHYLYTLSLKNKATVILGNHDTFLIEFFEMNFVRAYFNIQNNGFGKTLSSLCNSEVNSETDLSDIHPRIYKDYYSIYKWLKSLPYYYELGKYIFVHGGVNGDLNNWKETSIRDMIWSKEFDQKPIPNRIVVSGHQRVATIRVKTKDYKKLFSESPEEFEVLDLGNKILIDGFVEVSKKINVLILDE